jgi:hypothetical protein
MEAHLPEQHSAATGKVVVPGLRPAATRPHSGAGSVFMYLAIAAAAAAAANAK